MMSGDPETARGAPPSIGSLDWTPANHFRLRFFEAIARLRGAWPQAGAELGFLGGYYSELDLGGEPDAALFTGARAAWEERSEGLPLLDLARVAGLDDHAVSLLFAIGLIEEDHRFANVFELLQGAGQQRPMLGLLQTWLGDGETRAAVARLEGLGLVEVVNPADPRMTWSLQVSTLIWDALRGGGIGERPAGPKWQAISQLPSVEDLILSPADVATAQAVVPLLEGGAVGCVIVRGPQSSGRRTLIGAIARGLGRGVVELELSHADAPDTQARCLAALAILLRALPVIRLELGSGETFSPPATAGALGPLAVTLGTQGGLAGSCLDRAVTLRLAVPAPGLRRRHWERALPGCGPPQSEELASRHRMTGGNIRLTAGLALAQAALAGRDTPTSRDVRQAVRTRSSQLLDTLAQRVATIGDWDQLALADATMDELRLLERRCRHREALGESVGRALRGDLSAGVRALFTGPSGTGKTLAARAVAGVLDVDLYRLDLSMVVNKYIGETEKNLSRLFARAEEADIALLLDEGDSLLTQRTAVESSNDRYANLETNYLLQRLETFEGILIVTTNAGERIDTAFRRRMDVVVEFNAPEPLERWSIWLLHLPDEHSVSTAALEEISALCALTGGQIRNAVLHAAVLALARREEIREDDLYQAVRREYAKAGQVCPLPRTEVVGG